MIKKILIFIFSIACFFSCLAKDYIYVKDIESNWTNFVKIKLIDNTKEINNKIYPDIVLKIEKVSDKPLHSVKCKINYDYGYNYFSKEEIVYLTENSIGLEVLNNGKIFKKEFTYDSVKKIQVPKGQKFDIILHGVKVQAKIIELSHYKRKK